MIFVRRSKPLKKTLIFFFEIKNEDTFSGFKDANKWLFRTSGAHLLFMFFFSLAPHKTWNIYSPNCWNPLPFATIVKMFYTKVSFRFWCFINKMFYYRFHTNKSHQIKWFTVKANPLKVIKVFFFCSFSSCD